MWIRKTEFELIESRNKKEKNSRKMGLMGFIFVLTFFILIDKYYGEAKGRFVPHGAPLTWTDIYYKLPYYIALSLIIGILLYLSLRKIKKTTLICPNCGRKKNFDNIFECSCGGTYKNIEEMKWVDK
ncbi:MAG: hypothetical protein PHD97_11880 [Bacteroidales bacterium]|nr:hypothetical protein [Bacteroidales bacterium]